MFWIWLHYLFRQKILCKRHLHLWAPEQIIVYCPNKIESFHFILFRKGGLVLKSELVLAASTEFVCAHKFVCRSLKELESKTCLSVRWCDVHGNEQSLVLPSIPTGRKRLFMFYSISSDYSADDLFQKWFPWVLPLNIVSSGSRKPDFKRFQEDGQNLSQLCDFQPTKHWQCNKWWNDR